MCLVESERIARPDPRVFGYGLLVLLLGSLDPAYAQTAPNATIKPFSEAGVTISPYDSLASPTFAKFVRENPALARLVPYSAILTNSSGKNIVALTTTWTWLDAEGEPISQPFRHNSLFLGRLPIAPSNSRVLLTSANNWPEAVLAQSGFGGSGDDGVDAENFERSSAVIFELDTVIFEDGLVIGPDKSETVAFYQARKRVAEIISGAALLMLDAGRDPIGLLSEFAKYGRTRTDFVGFWYEEIATMLLRIRSSIERKELAEQLSQIPDLNHLHRNH